MAPKKSYTAQQMSLAMDAVMKGESCSSASKRFGVPRMTLRNKVTGKSPASCTMGPSPILSSDEEALLVQWLFAMAERHCPVGKEQLLDSVQLIMKSNKRENPFTDDRPGRKWYELFLKRHPEVSERISQNLTTSREAVKEENIVQWFSEVTKYMDENQLSEALRDPSRVFNADESAFFLNPKPGRVLVKRGDKNIYTTSGNEKENLTVLLTANAAGKFAPPMIVFSYERIPKYIAESIPNSWGIGRSESGWMCGCTFFEYISNIFYPWLIENKVELPVIFFLDGHASHLTKHLSDFCSDKQIEIVVLYPNSTHLLQPMDLAVFRPLKLFWKQQVKKWKTENLGQIIKKENFAPILKSALENITPDCIRNGFRAGGIFPFGPELIDFSKLNVFNRSLTTKNTSDFVKNETFLSQLEKEIVKIFTQSKLDNFNKCFYLTKAQMSAELPDEDLTLYTIWAKYKHLCQVVGVERNIEITTAENRDEGEGVDSNPFQDSTTQNQELVQFVPLEKTASKEMPSYLTPNKQVGQGKLTNITNLPSTSSGFAQHMQKEKGIVVPSPFKTALFWPEPMTQKRRRISKEKIPSVVTSKAWKDFHNKKETVKKSKEEAKEQRKQKRVEKKDFKEMMKINKLNDLKKSTGKQSFKKRQRRISVTSSDTDTNITYAESEASDYKVEDDINLNDEAETDETMTKAENFEADEMEITHEKYASETSPVQPAEKCSLKDSAPSFQKENDENLKSGKTERAISPSSCLKTPISPSLVLVEELPHIESITTIEDQQKFIDSCASRLSPKQLLKNRLNINDYVVISWNERFYPGQIISMSQEGLLVSCMKKSNSFWRWPAIKDIELYSWDKVVCQIGIPKFIKKGCFEIPEMDNL